jgi:hypothetical protein
MPAARQLLRPGNKKLGPHRVWNFSIPAYHTCRPGRTEICARNCYARNLERFRPSVRKSLRENLKATRSADFVERVCGEIAAKKARLVRVHTSGDFYSAAYAAAWAQVARRCPKTLFWTYTRSWRDPAIRRVLSRAAARKNVRLWFSADRETGDPGRVPARVRVAYLQDAADDVPARADLVFRPRRLRRERAAAVATARGGRAPVCPTETGAPRAHEVTCETCRECWRPDPPAPGRRIPLRVV